MLTRRTPTAAPTRGGFSLVEILMVIAIIAILGALALVGVNRAAVAGKRTSAVSDISQLTTALSEFKREFGFYPPTPTGTTPFVIPTSTATTEYKVFKRMFPRWNSTNAEPPSPAIAQFSNETAATSSLDANQCMVYFLGGPTGTGWHPTKPEAPTGTGTKKGPYFDFPKGRMFGGQFRDPWETPYFYFPSKSDGSYDTNSVTITNKEDTSVSYTMTPFTTTSAAPHKFVNASGVQIVSAGEYARPSDFGPKFGPGGYWTAGSGSYADGSDGADDLANFNGGIQLGFPAK
jgi:prepilin-type N-terminal cleavage/methylation domain-containing protein